VTESGIPEWPGPGAPIEELLRFQAAACGHLGSRLYEGLLTRAAADFEGGGQTRSILARHQGDPTGSFVVLRLMGAVHRLVLEGRAPELAKRYRAGPRAADGPDDAGDAEDAERTWSAFRAMLEEHADELDRSIERPVQTNEVGRCVALLPGFLEAASATGLPLRLLEVGASAGLNLRWDAYRYEAGDFAWGPPGSPLRLSFEMTGGPPPAADVAVEERRGCDASPVDPTTEDGRLTLLSYCWPDQADRIERLQAALEIAATRPAEVDRSAALDWATARLAEPATGMASVLYHSIVMQYLPDDEREAFEETVAAAGGRASQDAPLAWLRMEPAGGWTEVRMKSWPGGEDRLLATAGYHGTPVDLSAAAG
jgi:hypothetical protein